MRGRDETRLAQLQGLQVPVSAPHMSSENRKHRTWIRLAVFNDWTDHVRRESARLLFLWRCQCCQCDRLRASFDSPPNVKGRIRPGQLFLPVSSAP